MILKIINVFKILTAIFKKNGDNNGHIKNSNNINSGSHSLQINGDKVSVNEHAKNKQS